MSKSRKKAAPTAADVLHLTLSECAEEDKRVPAGLAKAITHIAHTEGGGALLHAMNSFIGVRILVKDPDVAKDLTPSPADVTNPAGWFDRLMRSSGHVTRAAVGVDAAYLARIAIQAYRHGVYDITLHAGAKAYDPLVVTGESDDYAVTWILAPLRETQPTLEKPDKT